MSSNVIGISGHRPTQLGEPNAALIEALEDTLERARSGQLQSLIATGFVSDGARFALWVDAHENVYEMLGSIAWLQHEYVDRHVQSAS